MARLGLVRRFVRLVVTDQAARGGAEYAMMAGEMSSNAANKSAFDASFRLGRHAQTSDRRRKDGAFEQLFHEADSRCVTDKRARLGLVPRPFCCSGIGRRSAG
jgi:hypothetical protein